MTLRTYRAKHLIRTAIALCLTAAYSPVVASQETKDEAALRRSSCDGTFPCPSAAARKEIPETQGRQAANLTGIPVAQEQSNPSSSSSHPQAENSAVLFLPVTTSQRLSFNDKFTIYAHQTFGPPAVIFPAFAAGMGMANPKNHYPRECGYDDLTHAEQRMTIQFMDVAIQNMAAEFQPQWGRFVRKLRIQKILPEWWVPQHEK